jgi:hypothetical protein
MVRVVIEIPHGFAEYCKAMGDKPADVILDLIDEFMDEPLGPIDTVARAIPDIAEFLRERD